MNRTDKHGCPEAYLSELFAHLRQVAQTARTTADDWLAEHKAGLIFILRLKNVPVRDISTTDNSDPYSGVQIVLHLDRDTLALTLNLPLNAFKDASVDSAAEMIERAYDHAMLTHVQPMGYMLPEFDTARYPTVIYASHTGA